jgi:flagellar assembly protein FliH
MQVVAPMSSESSPDAVRWEAPAFGSVAPPGIADLEEIERAVREDGFARGHAEGFAQGQADVRRLVARLEGITDAFTRPLAGLDNDIEHALAALATEIAGALVRQNYIEQPERMAALVREAIVSAGEMARALEVRVHPDDLQMLRPLLPEVPGLVPDISLARGDVRVHAEHVRIDARLATRLKRVLENLSAKPTE